MIMIMIIIIKTLLYNIYITYVCVYVCIIAANDHIRDVDTNHSQTDPILFFLAITISDVHPAKNKHELRMQALGVSFLRCMS